MTVTDLDTHRATSRRLTVEKRATGLVELAEACATERRHRLRPFTDVLPALVPSLTDPGLSDPLSLFDGLVDAVSVRGRLIADGRDDDAQAVQTRLEILVTTLVGAA